MIFSLVVFLLDGIGTSAKPLNIVKMVSEIGINNGELIRLLSSDLTMDGID